MPTASGKVTFDGFTPEDFDAYLPEKWNSNMFTLPRRKVKGKLEALGVQLGDQLRESGLGLVMHLSDEFPSLWNKKKVDVQWLFFSRDEAARNELTDLIDTERTLAETLADPTPLYRHVFLGVAVNAGFLEFGIWLPFDAWVDRKNLGNRLADADGLAAFAGLLGRLPEHYQVGVVGEDEFVAPQLSDSELTKLFARFEQKSGWLFLGARLPSDQVPILGADIKDTAHAVFADLQPVYGAIAWSPENDAISLDRLVAERQEALRNSHLEYERERQERERQLQQRQEQGKQLREEIAERVKDTQAWRQRETAARRAAYAKAQAAEQEQDARAKAEALAAKLGLGGAAPEEKGPVQPTVTPKKESAVRAKPIPGKKPRFTPPKGKEVGGKAHRPKGALGKPRGGKPGVVKTAKVSPERAADIQSGDGVEVVKGFLKGRMGVVQEMDEKGRLRISFGPLSSWLDGEEVAGRGPAESGR